MRQPAQLNTWAGSMSTVSWMQDPSSMKSDAKSLQSPRHARVFAAISLSISRTATSAIAYQNVQTTSWCFDHFNTHTRTRTRLTALCPGLPGWAGTRKVKPIWIILKHETVSGSGIRWIEDGTSVITQVILTKHTQTQTQTNTHTRTRTRARARARARARTRTRTRTRTHTPV